MVKVSIIVPVYNSEKYLNKCLDSLVSQTLKNIEIIIINDGSTDNSLKIIKDYESKFSNIICINNENHGIGFSRNCGIEKAKGKYIIFVDSDDYISTSMAEKLYKFSEKNKLDITVCDYYRINEITHEKDIFEIEDFGITDLESNKALIYKINHSPWNKLYKRELFLKNNILFPTDLKYEDVAIFIPLLKYASKIGKFNEPLNYYIIHNNSETTVMDKRVFDIFKILDIVNNYYKDSKYKKYLEYLTVQKITTYTIQQRYQKNGKLRNKFINEAFKYLNIKYPKWRNSKYFDDRNIFKSSIEKSKFLTKIYCVLYTFFK